MKWKKLKNLVPHPEETRRCKKGHPRQRNRNCRWCSRIYSQRSKVWTREYRKTYMLQWRAAHGLGPVIAEVIADHRHEVRDPYLEVILEGRT